MRDKGTLSEDQSDSDVVPERMIPDSLGAEVGTFEGGPLKWKLPGLGVAALVTLVSSGLMWDRFQKSK